MRRHSTFWAIVLILMGVLLLLEQVGALRFLGVSVWGLIWPLLLILAGIWVMLGITCRGRPVEVEQATIPLSGASRARLRIHYGAGRLQLGAGAEGDVVLSGSFGGGLDCRRRQEGDTLGLDLRRRSHDWAARGAPWSWDWGTGSCRDWSLSLNREVPLALDLEAGASDIYLDLSDLLVTELRLQTGASSIELRLPVHAGETRVRTESGAASLKIRVPEGVAARIRVSSALSESEIDTHRFPRQGDLYQSADYESAANRVDLRIESAVGSVEVR